MKRKHNLTKISNISWTIEKIVIFIVLNFFPPKKQKAEKLKLDNPRPSLPVTTLVSQNQLCLHNCTTGNSSAAKKDKFGKVNLKSANICSS